MDETLEPPLVVLRFVVVDMLVIVDACNTFKNGLKHSLKSSDQLDVEEGYPM